MSKVLNVESHPPVKVKSLSECKDEVAKAYFDAHHFYCKTWEDFENACWRDGDSEGLRKANDQASELYASQFKPIN